MQASMMRLLKPADCISMMNVGFGFIALLLLSYRPNDELFIHLSFSFILLALLADGLDGIIARRTEKGLLGEYFEAIGDMISMGIAPSFFVFMMYKSTIQTYSLILIIGLFILLLCYVLCCSIRLAAFHPLRSKRFFTGLPASAATLLLISSASLGFEPVLIAIIIVIAALLMISTISFPKPTKMQNGITTCIIFSNIFFGMFYDHILVYFLLFSVAVYIIVGPIYIMKKKNI